MPNIVQIGQGVAEIWPFSIFQDVGRRPSWILKKNGNFDCPNPSESQNASSYQILCRSVKRCGDMAVYNFSRWRPSAILDFKKFKILTAHTIRRAKVYHRAKFCANRSRLCRDMTVFVFSRWQPSAILDLLYACSDHPRSVFWWSLSLCKIWFESVQ